MSGDPEIVWEKPPPIRATLRANTKWIRVVERLQARPGVWAKVKASSKSRPANAHARLKDLGAEAASRRGEDGLYSLYARWPVEMPNGNGPAPQVCEDCGHQAETPAALRVHARRCPERGAP